MLLAFDIGNTETTVGLFDGTTLRGHWRLTTHAPRTPDELRFTLQQLIESADISVGTFTIQTGSPIAPPSLTRADSIDAVAICSVVPPVTPIFAEACAACFVVTPLIVTASSPLPITLAVDDPATVGADRVVNTLVASHIYKRDVIVVDLGTATTYDCITANGTFLGGVIQPGVQSSSESLFRRTSMLPATALTIPERVIGTNTADCIKAGVVFGAAEAIDGIIRRIKTAWPTPGTPYVVATGGLASTLRPLCHELDDVDPTLTLKGVQLAHSILAG